MIQLSLILEYIREHKQSCYIAIGNTMLLISIYMFAPYVPPIKALIIIPLIIISTRCLIHGGKIKGTKSKSSILKFYQTSYEKQKKKIILLEHEIKKIRDETSHINTLSYPIDEDKLMDEINLMTGK